MFIYNRRGFLGIEAKGLIAVIFNLGSVDLNLPSIKSDVLSDLNEL